MKLKTPTHPSVDQPHPSSGDGPSQAGSPETPTPEQDPWRFFHVLLALLLIIGFLSECRSLFDLVPAIHKLNSLEESGLVAAAVMVLGFLRSVVVRAISIVLRFLG